MHDAGQPVGRIAQAIGIHRNRVTQYLQFRVAYPPDALRRFVHKSPRLNTQFPMPLADVAPLLPGYPSPAKIADLRREGILKATRSTQRGRKLIISRAQTIKAAERMMPAEGLYIRSDSMSRLSFIEVTDHLTRHHMQYWPSREFFWVSACEVAEHLHVPAAQVHLANLCLKITGRCLLT
jgi:hypothetical protein